MTTIDSLFELATHLRDKGQLEHSTRVLSKILDDYPSDKDVWKVYTILGGVYRDLKQHKTAAENFKKATQLNPDSEFASLGLYVSLASLDKDVDTIEEMKRFLKSQPAKLYKDTLDELLDGLTKGFMTNYKDDIITLAKSNGFKI
jgi:tetratricopeptide (TPR) repeat protein